MESCRLAHTMRERERRETGWNERQRMQTANRMAASVTAETPTALRRKSPKGRFRASARLRRENNKAVPSPAPPSTKMEEFRIGGTFFYKTAVNYDTIP